MFIGAGVVAAILVALVVVFALGVGGSDDPAARGKDSSGSSQSPEATPPLESAYDYCSVKKGGRTLTLGDEGRTLVIDTESEYGPMGGLICVLAELDTSEAIIAQMENTTSMMGLQQADDGDLHYQFSYHPDNGINMVITDTGSTSSP